MSEAAELPGPLPQERAPLYQERYRPQFHFTARYWEDYRLHPPNHYEGWMNDLNGLMFNQGEYHLFAQRWWSAWLHAISTDLVHWEELRPAFGKGGKFGGTQSGGGVVDFNNCSGLGDGKEPPMIVFWSSTDNFNQCISYSRDRGRTWIKYEKNPVLKHAYRDPNVFWYEPDQKWILILYGPSDLAPKQNSATKQTGRRASLLTVSKEETENCYLLFSSTNLLDWKQLEARIPDSFECPNMFELPVEGETGQTKWVVVDGNGDYVIGSFDGNSFRAEAKKRKGDYGRNFYATMTFNHMPKSDPRRIQIAWMRAWDDYPKDMPFNQQASFPCELSLRKLPQGLVMCRYPVREIRQIEGQAFQLPNYVCRPQDNPLSALQGDLFDLELTIDTDRSTCSSIQLELCGNTVAYDLRNRTLESYGSKALLEPRSGRVQICVLVDRLSIETFGNQGEVSITNFAQQKPGTPSLVLRVPDGEALLPELTVHPLESIWRVGGQR